MNIIKEADFRREIKTAPRAGYLFFGEEDYLKAFAVRTAREIVSPDPTFAFFNEMRLDATDFSPQKLIDALMPMPMMADKKIVTLTGLNFNTMRQSDLDGLCEALAAVVYFVARKTSMLSAWAETAMSRKSFQSVFQFFRKRIRSVPRQKNGSRKRKQMTSSA